MAKKFVCVRIQSMNGVNLNRFQFEYDLTWMSFFQNGAGENYARYGGREDSSSESHMTKKSLLLTMQKVLDLHRTNSVQPNSKFEPRDYRLSTPEDIPAMKKMMSKRKVSCIHCHDVKGAQLREIFNQGKLEKSMIYTYPSPRNLGMVIDADDQTLIKKILSDSPAHKAELKAGDRIQTFENQRVLTFADMTRVLHLMPERGTISVQVERGSTRLTKTISFAPGWKATSNPRWRASKNLVGPNSGFWAKTLNRDQRKRRGIKPDEFGLQVVVVWGKWARQAGVRNGDVILKLEGFDQTPVDKVQIQDLQTHLQLNRKFGETAKLQLLRGSKRIPITMALPVKPTE